MFDVSEPCRCGIFLYFGTIQGIFDLSVHFKLWSNNFQVWEMLDVSAPFRYERTLFSTVQVWRSLMFDYHLGVGQLFKSGRCLMF